MVAAIPTTASPTTTASAASTAPGSKNMSLPNDPHNPSHPPLIPSEKDNAAAAVSRRPRTKEISRYLSSYSSASSTTSTSYFSLLFFEFPALPLASGGLPALYAAGIGPECHPKEISVRRSKPPLHPSLGSPPHPHRALRRRPSPLYHHPKPLRSLILPHSRSPLPRLLPAPPGPLDDLFLVDSESFIQPTG